MANDTPVPPVLADSLAASEFVLNAGNPQVLANLALANQIFVENLRQQNAVAQQQAFNHLTLAIVAKCAQLILAVDPKTVAEVRPVLDNMLELLERLHRQAGAAGAAVATPPVETATTGDAPAQS